VKILACDLASDYSGWCLIEDGHVEDYGLIDCHKLTNSDDKIITLGMELYKLIKQFCPDELVIEDIYLKYFRTFKLLAKLQGVAVWIWWVLHLDHLILLKCTEARKSIGIPGNAQKSEVLKYINKKFNFRLTDDNIADAFVLGWATFKKLKKLSHDNSKTKTS